MEINIFLSLVILAFILAFILNIRFLYQQICHIQTVTNWETQKIKGLVVAKDKQSTEYEENLRNEINEKFLILEKRVFRLEEVKENCGSEIEKVLQKK